MFIKSCKLLKFIRCSFAVATQGLQKHLFFFFFFWAEVDGLPAVNTSVCYSQRQQEVQGRGTLVADAIGL